MVQAGKEFEMVGAGSSEQPGGKFTMRITNAVALLSVSLILPACASKGYVQRNVKNVDDKVESLSSTVQENQNRISQNEDAIAGVKQDAQNAQQAANHAQQSADSANSAAQQASNTAQEANTTAQEVDKNSKKLVYEVVLSADEADFKFGNSELPDAAKAKLDDMVQQLKADPKNAYFEIEGYTDSTGDADYNQKLGLARAEAVKRYLYTQHQIPLHRMNTISYGEENPVAPNNTRAGRAQNRRVVIKVLA
jgi:peptidoglycan-associated lipoprotein